MQTAWTTPGAQGEIIMSTTAIVILLAVLAVGGITWLVIYSGRRGQKHREETSIKPPETHKEGRAS